MAETLPTVLEGVRVGYVWGQAGFSFAVLELEFPCDHGPKASQRISQAWTMTPPHSSFWDQLAKAGREERAENRQLDGSCIVIRKRKCQRRGKCQGQKQ